MSKRRMVLATEDATHIRVSTSAKEWINKRALAKGVAAWMIVDELVKRRAKADGTK